MQRGSPGKGLRCCLHPTSTMGGGTELSPPVPQALRGSPVPPRTPLPRKQDGSPPGALAQPPGTATEQPHAPALAPSAPQHGEMELNLFCIRLLPVLCSTKRLKNNKEKAKPSTIITSL